MCNMQQLISDHRRCSAAGLILHKVLAPALGIPLDAKVAEDSRKVLHSALSTMNRVWITEQAPFLGGLPQPSIADISLACELTQLKVRWYGSLSSIPTCSLLPPLRSYVLHSRKKR